MQKIKLKYFVLIVASLHIFLSCKDKYILSEKQMTDVLYDIEIAQGLSQAKYDAYSSKEQRDALLAGILDKHNITKEQLDSSLVWYSDRIDTYRKIRDSVNLYIENKQRHYGELLNRESLLTNTGSNFPTYFYLTAEQPVFSFSFDSLQLLSLKLTKDADFRFRILGRSPQVRIKSYLYFNYNDTSFTNTEYIDNDSVVIDLNIMSDRRLLDFAGYIRVDSIGMEPYKVLFYNYRLDNDSVKNKTIVPSATTDVNTTPLQFRKDNELLEKK